MAILETTMLETSALIIELCIRKREENPYFVAFQFLLQLSLIPNPEAEAHGANCAACVLDRVTHQAARLGSGVRTAPSKCLEGVEWNTDPAFCLAFPCRALAGLGSAQP